MSAEDDDYNRELLREIMREAFERSGLTQQQLANKLGCGKGEVSRRLHKPGDLRWSTFHRTLAAMGVTCRFELVPRNQQ